MIGWFSLNVPAALGIYWVANNFITTAISMQIRSSISMEPVAPSGGSASGIIDTPTTSAFTPAPMREKPSGFGDSGMAASSSSDVTPITPIDAEIVDSVTEEGTDSGESKGPSKKRGKKKKKKKRS